MQAIDALIEQVNDEKLKERLKQEVRKLQDNKKFGLVFENHLPEATPLYGAKITKGSKVTEKNGKFDRFYVVREINGDEAICEQTITGIMSVKHLNDLLPVAEFGDPIYPSLKKIDHVMNALDSDLWHTLIEADNYHALQLLEYLYAGKVDCIYIDPPYNTGAKDWKYNNDYVDGNDSYRHSKWLSFMEKRLKLAKKLLNPANGVLICAIDDNELNTLGLLLEEVFSGYKRFCITVVHNPNGNQGKNFGVSNEFVYFVLPTGNQILSLENRTDTPDVRPLRDVSGNSNLRTDAKNCFYPIFVKNNEIIGFGDVCENDFHPASANILREDGVLEIYPIDAKGIEKKWVFANNTVESIKNELKIEWNKSRGIWDVIRYKTHFTYKTVWNKKEFSANSYGSKLINNIFGEKRFDYPKSLYAVKECIAAVCGDRKNALIVDFFAGSGTTLHAVNLLNAEDGGHRMCICVTNNEVGPQNEKKLSKEGFHPGDEEWERLGVAKYVTWPRTVCSIEGHNIHGVPLKGNYIGSDIPMANGFKANVIYFKLEFLNKTAVRIGLQFRELLSILWMKAGAHGECPELSGVNVPSMMILPENQMAILKKESLYSEFLEKVKAEPSIKTLYFVTDSIDSYRNMISDFRDYDTYQLYSDYLNNFRINDEEARQ